MGGGGHPLDFLLTITPVRRLLITNCLLCRGEEWWAHPCARIPIFGWSDRNFRCIIYSRFNEPRKRSKGPRGLFLIIRRTREGRVSRSPSPLFSCAPSLPPLLPHPPLHLLVPRFQCRTVFYPSSLLRFLRPPSLRDLLLDRRYFITGLLVQFFSTRVSFALFLSPGEKREDWYVWYKSYTGMVRSQVVSGTVSQRFNRWIPDFKKRDGGLIDNLRNCYVTTFTIRELKHVLKFKIKFKIMISK